MSKYKYEGFGVIRNTETDFPYHTDDIAELLEEKDQQISDLEAKLADITRKYELSSLSMGGLVDTARNLEQQLAEKEQEIESLRENSLSKRIFKEKLIPSHCMEQYEKYEQQIDKLTQDKISFAVEQLEKVKAELFKLGQDYSLNWCGIKIYNFIDDQINELKGKVEVV